MSEPEGAQKVLDLIKDIHVAMLTTVTADGSLESRPMGYQRTENYDGSLYFIAEKDSDVATQIAANPEVNLAFTSANTWVSIQGAASVSTDVTKLKQIWDAGTDTFAKGDPEDGTHVLIAVDPRAAHYWDAPAAPVVLVSMIKAKLTGEQARPGESGTAQM